MTEPGAADGEQGAGEGGVWRIDVFYVDGPLKYLQNHWVFRPAGEGGCEIDFFVDFQFQSRIFERLIGPLFNEMVRRMVGAFEGRAYVVYAPREADAHELKSA
jgi:coenzyme Q-binding protein COQ10